jgi:hypothetical protein
MVICKMVALREMEISYDIARSLPASSQLCDFMFLRWYQLIVVEYM